MNTATIVTYAALALVIAAVVIFAMLSERRRAKALQAFASDLGFHLVNKVSSEVLPGHGTVGSAVEGASSGRPAVLFDWICETGRGRHRKTHVTTVAAFASPLRTLPQFELRKRGLLTLGKHLKFQDDPAFSKKLVVSGTDETAIRERLNPQLREFLVAELAGSPLQIEARPDWILVYQLHKRISGSKYRGFFEGASRIAARIVGEVPAVPGTGGTRGLTAQ